MRFLTNTYSLSCQDCSYTHYVNNIFSSIYALCSQYNKHNMHINYIYCALHNNTMQQLTIEHKKSTNNTKQVVSRENRIEELENKREGHGLNIALTRNVYRLLTSDVYYVQSEHSDEIYYYVKYNPDVFEWCSCPDNSTRGIKCKHQFAIEYA